MQTILFQQNKVFRNYVHALISELNESQLNFIPDGFKNSIIWNVGHLVISQQMLTYGLSGLTIHAPMDWVGKFKIGSKAEEPISEREISQLKEQLTPLIEQTEIDYNRAIFKEFKPFHTSYGASITNIDEAIAFNNYHEGNHIGHILTMKKLL